MTDVWSHKFLPAERIEATLVKGIESIIYFKHGFPATPFAGGNPPLVEAALQVRPTAGGVVHVWTKYTDAAGNWDLDDPENSWVILTSDMTLDIAVNRHLTDIVLTDSDHEWHLPLWGTVEFKALITRPDEDLSTLAGTTRLDLVHTCLNARRVNMALRQAYNPLVGTVTTADTALPGGTLDALNTSAFSATDDIFIMNPTTYEQHTGVVDSVTPTQITLTGDIPITLGNVGTTTLSSGAYIYKYDVGDSPL